jgi:hypothetical protein
LRGRPERDLESIGLGGPGGFAVSFSLSIQVDPHAILGVAPGASLHEIREAYRRKAKQHHPDHGGEEWAFRILAQSYEVLSTARVVRATETEFRSRSQPTYDPNQYGQARTEAWGDSQGGPTHAGSSARSAPTAPPGETVRPGVRDAADDPNTVVAVEKLLVRYEVDQLWLMQDGKREDRYLSCTLNLSWPDQGIHPEQVPDAEEILKKISEAFEDVHLNTPVSNSRGKVEDGRFEGWLSYPSTQLAWAALNRLHEGLNARGLSVRQWTRDLIIPRDWR